MEIAVAILSVAVGALVVIQGVQMVQAKRNRNKSMAEWGDPNPSVDQKLDAIASKLDNVNNQLGKMELHLINIWDKVSH